MNVSQAFLNDRVLEMPPIPYHFCGYPFNFVDHFFRVSCKPQLSGSFGSLFHIMSLPTALAIPIEHRRHGGKKLDDRLDKNILIGVYDTF
jgi:hypothetical protein